ncbi:hypothetical protein OPT61_g691 [Boeremia exigua]|uniref:Uncharacterized protein n=1 Tax=Boeremia exigua TaxID=749465 RepID=A0ACC2ISY8_9PLEO|nr:hypothetical protein OPT61_g691 [Boeremia exigua]
MQHGHRILAEQCVRCISIYGRGMISAADARSTSRHQYHTEVSMLEYSANYWQKHFRKAIETLLNNSVNVNVEGRRYGNALEAASKEGHEEVIKLLLDAGAR